MKTFPIYNEHDMRSCYKNISKNPEKEITDIINEKTFYKYRKKELLRKLTEMRDHFNITDFEKQVMDKLIGDHRIHSKIRFVYDGSFLLNRILLSHKYPNRSGSYMKIFGFEFTYNMHYDIAPCIKYGFSIEEIKKEEDRLKKLSVAKSIDYIIHHFKYIFIQECNDKTYVDYLSDQAIDEFD